MLMHETSMHSASQLAAVAPLMHSSGNTNFLERRSLEKLYDYLSFPPKNYSCQPF